MRPRIPTRKTPVIPITKNPITPQKTPPSHQDFEAERILSINHPKTTIKIIIPSRASLERPVFSGNSMTSPRSKGAIRSIASVRPAPYVSFLKLGVRFSSIILLDIKSVMTHSSPRPTSIRISLSVGAMRMRRPLSRFFCPIHQFRAITIPTSSIVLPCRSFTIAIPT